MKKYKRLVETPEQTNTPEFKKWFGRSKVVDKSGKPLVVYHGSKSSFNIFSRSSIGKNFDFSIGFHFTNDPKESEVYSGKLTRATNPNIMPVYLKINNPLILKTTELNASTLVDYDRNYIASEVVKNKYDGVIVTGKDGYKNYIVFKSNQIKSAIGNNGNFNPRSDNILESGNVANSTFNKK